MHKRDIYTILDNMKIANNVYRMVLAGDTQYITTSGQFINVEIDGLYLRRPISVCDYNESTITIVYKVLGKGTDLLSQMATGQTLDILTGLGNGFSIDNNSKKPLLIAGGVGTPPMYHLAKSLLEKEVTPTVILGFTGADDVFFENEFRAMGCEVYITTIDGSYGTKGVVTDVMKTIGDYDYFYSCGPLPMLKAIATASKTSGQLSFEERMGCGFGGCMGCSCQTLIGNKRICVDGPVLQKEEILW
ncbi:MAG: dihydroorotate dehydrogenase electron transfer subunit [Bacillota bacterium]